MLLAVVLDGEVGCGETLRTTGTFHRLVLQTRERERERDQSSCKRNTQTIVS